MNHVDVIGCGGHCRSVLTLLRSLSVDVEGIYDDGYFKPGEQISGIPILGRTQNTGKNSVVLAVGDNAVRKSYYNSLNVSENNFISPHALIAETAELGSSNLIFPMAFINGSARIGSNNIINSKALIEHETVVGDHNHISVGAILAGRVKLGNNVFVGAGAVIIDGIEVKDNITIGAGSVVINDVSEPGVYVGNPAKRIK